MSRVSASKLGWSALVSGSLPRAAPASEGLGRVVTQSQVDKAQDAQALQQLSKPSPQAVQSTILKTFDLHIGASLPIPTKDKRDTHRPEPLPALNIKQGAAAGIDPFAGLPFRSLAERLGAHMEPAVEQMRADQRRSRIAGHTAASSALELPPVPHLLPFTRWASKSERFKSTFIAEAPKDRKRARLSWYHPDDTMVPRGWWKAGLLADLAYYKPFSREA